MAAGRTVWLAVPSLFSLLLCGCPGPSTADSQPRANDPLQAMKHAYRQATSYTDAADLRIELVPPSAGDEEQRIPLAVSLERPNKLRVDAFGANVVCDGKQFYGIVADPAMSDQILYHQAPPDLTVKQIYSDPVLDQMLSDGTGIRLPQLQLLLDDQPLESVFGTGFTSKRLEDKSIEKDESPCQRVEVQSEKGRYVAWIDPQTHVLRRLEMPSALFLRGSDPAPKVEFRVWAEFNGAKLGSKIDEDAFKFEAPSSAMLLKWFVAPPPSVRNEPHELLGKQPQAFKFVDLKRRAVDLQSLQGKIVVLDFWFLNCPYCFAGFPYLEKVYNQYRGNDRVAFLAVDTDEPSQFPTKCCKARSRRPECTCRSSATRNSSGIASSRCEVVPRPSSSAPTAACKTTNWK